MNNTEQMTECLTEHFKKQSTITTKDLKEMCREKYPNTNFYQTQVSKFLMETDLVDMFDDNGQFRVYYRTNNPQTVTEQDLVKAYLELGYPFTKTRLKSWLRVNKFSLDDWKPVFELMNFEHTGHFTSDNHKIYTLRNSGEHFSKSKQTAIPIKEMAKPYLRNAFLKLWNLSHEDLDEVLANSDGEMYQLLEAFFTYDIRQELKQFV